jgi:hypothetical protein
MFASVWVCSAFYVRAAARPAQATGGTPSVIWALRVCLWPSNHTFPLPGDSHRLFSFAVLMQAYRWIADSRDQYSKERLQAIDDEFKVS